MKTVCEFNKCAGCMACMDICPKKAIRMEDRLFAYNAIIQEEKCIDCKACTQVCQSNHPAQAAAPMKWYQGWAEDPTVRQKGASGGFAAAISSAFLEAGGVVCGCVFQNGKFLFEFADSPNDFRKFMGSKYVKSNPVGAYKDTKERLKKGQKVLFIGLPCQVSAMKNFVGRKLAENLYTVDLICHGTPSPELLERFLKQYGYSLTNLREIQFRAKAKFQVYGDGRSILTKGVSDKFSIAFLNSLIYTENCYHCPYAKRERVSDLTLGDSWGSQLEAEEQKKGISLALCQTKKGTALLEMAGLHLETVDIENAIEHNHQLKHPSAMPKGRETFFKEIEKKKFNALVFRMLPKQCFRQDVKHILIQSRILRRGGK